MILAITQVTFLLLTAWKLQGFSKEGHRYRPVISFIAACWAGGCLALATSILLHWPEVVGMNCAYSALGAGAMCAAVFHSGGNVAVVLRRLRLISY